ncbi:MAG: carbonic anhydrase family protein [Nitrospirota bacterium]|nr:MAG: carbonic anhydrase family protein [Nitrospirota bacterium]
MVIRFDSAASRPGKGYLPASIFLCFVLPFLFWATSVGAEDWNYFGKQGPGQWKGFCIKGHQQSPVNITDIKHFDQSHLAAALLHLEPTHFHAEHIHNLVLLKADEGSILLYEGRIYELSQVHWHTPSEHKVRGQAFDMEMHWVFLPKKTKRKIPGGEVNFNAVVIAVLMEVTDDSQGLSVFDTVLTHIPPSEDVTDIKSLKIDMTKFLPPRTFTGNPFFLRYNKSTEASEYWQLGYYAYDGSLTTPPCTERVRWLLLPQLLPISQKEHDLYVQYAGDHSARPVQPLYEREKADPPPLRGINLPWDEQDIRKLLTPDSGP